MGRPDIAIDTGTSLIGGPEKDLKTIFAAVHDAKLVEDGNFKGYWTIPCATKLELSVQFGTISYPIDPLDTNLGKMNSGDRCLTSFFTINKSSSGRNIPEWIFGVAFLKNVYSVFRASPPAIGFAQLSREFVGYASSTPSLVEKSPAFQKQKKLGQTSKASTTRQKMRLSELVSTLILTCLAIRYLWASKTWIRKVSRSKVQLPSRYNVWFVYRNDFFNSDRKLPYSAYVRCFIQFRDGILKQPLVGNNPRIILNNVFV